MTEHSAAMAAPRHAWTTRALHMGVALAVIWQLLVSLAMQGPRRATPGDALFTTLSTVGLAALGLIVLFWLNLMVRRMGTDAGALFPRLSAARRAALWSGSASPSTSRARRSPRRCTGWGSC